MAESTGPGHADARLRPCSGPFSPELTRITPEYRSHVTMNGVAAVWVRRYSPRRPKGPTVCRKGCNVCTT